MTPKKHTLLPTGPMTVGCMDLMHGKTKAGTLVRIFYPTDLGPIKEQSSDKWTKAFLGEKYQEGIARLRVHHYFQSSYARSLTARYRVFYVPAVWEGALSKKKKFPIIVFSHGLTADRGLYSSVCSELASYGFIVAAVEHRDESAGATFTLSENGEKDWTLLKTDQKDEYKLRNEQVKIRATECSRLFDLMEKLNKGEEIKNELTSDFDLKSFTDRIDLSKPVIAGQSFGGATVLQTLHQDKRFVAGLSLDPWLFPLKKELNSIGSSVLQPILFVLMEGFQDKLNIQAMSFFPNKENTMSTVRKSSHLNQCDAIYLTSSFFLWFVDVGTNSIDRPLAMAINNSLIRQFLAKHLGDCLVGGYDETVLKDNSEHFVYEARGTASKMLGWS